MIKSAREIYIFFSFENEFVNFLNILYILWITKIPYYTVHTQRFNDFRKALTYTTYGAVMVWALLLLFWYTQHKSTFLFVFVERVWLILTCVLRVFCSKAHTHAHTRVLLCWLTIQEVSSSIWFQSTVFQSISCPGEHVHVRSFISDSITRKLPSVIIHFPNMYSLYNAKISPECVNEIPIIDPMELNSNYYGYNDSKSWKKINQQSFIHHVDSSTY